MKRLFHGDPPKRLFTFGCSFTRYTWATWANILGFELKVKYNSQFYNFGRVGSGNTYISNLISQADQYYHFNKNDLVIVCWTSITREDRWRYDQWNCYGNIYFSDTIYDDKIKEFLIDNTHFLMRDLANIKLVDNLLQSKTRYHFLSMKNIDDNTLFLTQDSHYKKLIINYNNILQKISPGYMEVLWNNDKNLKSLIDTKFYHKYYLEGHPNPAEHFCYLSKTFEYEFSDETKLIVKKTHDAYKKLILEVYDNVKEVTHPSNLPKINKMKYYSGCKKLLICDPEDITSTMIIS